MVEAIATSVDLKTELIIQWRRCSLAGRYYKATLRPVIFVNINLAILVSGIFFTNINDRKQ